MLKKKNDQIKILVVDDKPSNLRFLAKILTAQGYIVQKAISGQLALNAAFNSPPNLILLDIMMPDMNGYEVCRQLKAENKTQEIPVIFLTALNETTDKVKAFKLGAVDYITKPFQVEEVLARIENQIAIQKLSQKLKIQNEQLQQEIASRKESEEHLELFFSQSLDGFFFMMLDEPVQWDDTIDKERALDYIFTHQRITRVNNAMLEQYGTSKEQFIGLTPNDFFAHNIEYGRDLWRCFFDVGRLHIETDERRLDGSEIWVESDYICLYDSSGKIKGHFGIQRDISDRVSAQEKVKHTQRFLDSIIENIPNMIFVKNAQDLRFARFNKAGEELLGYSREELIGKNDYDFFPQSEADFFIAKDRQVLASRQLLDIAEEQIQTKHQGLRYLHTKKLPILDEMGTPEYLLGISEDITERKQAQALLQESEERFRQLAENIGAVFWMTDPSKNQMIYVSPAYEQIWGYSCQELYASPQNWIDAIHPEDRDRIIAALATQSQGNYYEEYRIVRFDGEIRWICDRAFPIHNELGQVYRIAGIAEDISDRKLAEEQLRKSEANLSTAQRVAHVGNWEFDLISQKITWSEEVFRIWGLDPTQPAPKYEEIFQLVHPDDSELWQSHVQQAIARGVSYEFDHRIIRPDGTIRYIEARGQSVFNAQGQVIKLFGTSLDISDRKQAEEKMRQALEQEKELSFLKSRFISMASHEFRTPLSTIQSAADLLQYYEWSSEEKQERFEQIRDAVHHMTQLLEDVLFIGKSDVGKLNVRPTFVNLTKFCLKLTSEMQLTAASQHTLNFVSHCAYLGAYLDEQLLRQVLTNLLSNAIKYSPTNSTIQFELLSVEKKAIFVIQDQGIGIPSADQPRLFESFHRAANVDNIAGTGLGLAIVKRCLDGLGGEITFSSQVGVGTTFCVTLPLKNDKAAESNKRQTKIF